MVNTVARNTKTWIQAIGLGLLAFLLVISMVPEKAHAFNLFNKNGNDGYFLSLTNDPANVRVVPISIYDQHHKAQNSKKFIEWVDVKVNYAKYPLAKDLPAVGGGESGRTGWVDKVYKVDSKTKKMDNQEILTWTFPGFAGVKKSKDYQASQVDLDRAQWVAETVVHDFNGAVSMVHGAIQRYGNGTLENMSPNQFANMITKIANAGYTAQHGGTGKIDYHGVVFTVKKAKNIKPVKGVSKNAYVTFKLTSAKKTFPKDFERTFIHQVDKGYHSGQELHNGLGGTFQNLAIDKKEVKILNWKRIVLQSNSNWSANNITFTNVGSITSMNKLEQAITDLASNTLTWLRQTLGLHSASDLILNGGTRGTDSYYKGIMPKIWMDSAAVLHWISYAIAWMLIIGAIVKLLIQRNVAAINPSERVDMINGIKNLMIVGFALSIFDVSFAGVAEMNHMIVNMLATSGTGIENFSTAPVGSGMLASVIVGVVFFCLDLYFNFFYISRALMVAILYAVGPLYVASIAFGEKYRQIFENYVKEIVGNIFVQSFQAILVVFFVGISIMGSLRTIETLVLLFCFIPMTRFFKESIGASSSASDAMTSTALGATSGAMAGVISSQFMKKNKNKGGKDNKSHEGGSDIKAKSGSSFGGGGGGGSGGGGKKQSAGSMIGHGAKLAAKGAGAVALGTVGAGLVAGGAATGMHGASQLGGLAIGGGMNMGGSVAGSAGRGAASVGKKGAKAAGSVGKASAKNLGDKFANSSAGEFVSNVGDKIASSAPVQGMKDMKDHAVLMADAGVNKLTGGSVFSTDSQINAAHKHDIPDFGAGTPEFENIETMADGSSVQSFNKHQFHEKTGISSMRDVDNNGMEMEIGTSYVDGQGFINGSSNGLGGSKYEQNMSQMVDAFKNNDTQAMAKYQEKGINSMNVDRNTNRVSFNVDKNRAGIGEVYNSGEDIHIQRNNGYGDRGTHSSGHANPFSHI